MIVQPSRMSDNQRKTVRLLYLIVVAQFAIIALLLGGLSNEYLSNAYMQAWITSHTPFLSLLLHGEVDSLLFGVAIGATFLLIQSKIRDAKIVTETRVSTSPATPSHLPAHAVQKRALQHDASPDPNPASSSRRSTKKPSDTISPKQDETDSEIF
jgi:hypothetical protein